MIELLAPGGNYEKLKMAILYGADAVYIGGEEFSLRAKADNFSKEDMIAGISFAHEREKKVYVTLNIIPRNDDFDQMEEYINEINEMKADAVIVSDPGIFKLVRNIAPDMDIHISTQANNTNYMSAKFWQEQGARRIVAARELSCEEISRIHIENPSLEIEAFVHGAMCISYSGRCLLSGYMTGRDSNRGDCAQSCRWGYHLVEEVRQGEYMPVYENERGTFIFNSKDLCLIEYIPDLIKSGVTSFKIEGRMKSSFYVSSVVGAYRKAIDSYYESFEKWRCDPAWLNDVQRASHREYTPGFFKSTKSDPGNTQIYGTNSYIREYDYIGSCEKYDAKSRTVTVIQKNKVSAGDEIEVIMPSGAGAFFKVTEMYDEEDNLIESAPHAGMLFKIKLDDNRCDTMIEQYSMLIKKSNPC